VISGRPDLTTGELKRAMNDSNSPNLQPTSDDASSADWHAAGPSGVVAKSPRIRFSTLLPLVLPVVLAVLAAYVQWATVGLPSVPTPQHITPETTTLPYGFPAW
jgi:hypothetical protein